MKPLDPRLLRLSRAARWSVVASAATGLVRTLATIGIAWGIATAVTLGVDAVRDGRLADGELPAAFVPTLALLAGAFVVRAIAAWAPSWSSSPCRCSAGRCRCRSAGSSAPPCPARRTIA